MAFRKSSLHLTGASIVLPGKGPVCRLYTLATQHKPLRTVCVPTAIGVESEEVDGHARKYTCVHFPVNPLVEKFRGYRSRLETEETVTF